MHESPISSSKSQVRIFQFAGTSQYLVKTDASDHSFINRDDAQRFAQQISPQSEPFEIQQIQIGQGFDKYSPLTSNNIKQLNFRSFGPSL